MGETMGAVWREGGVRGVYVGLVLGILKHVPAFFGWDDD